ncbi:MAG: S-methyl-5'-thioadenosine phosphorylase [Nanoarchaeota archaeon]
MSVNIGIIGGTGLEDPRILEDTQEKIVRTKYGNPSSPLIIGTIKGVDVILLSRHGKKHEFMPTNVPFQANIAALKELGCTHILATTACGSLQEKMKPGDLVFLDQFIDRTTKRKQTLYEEGRVCHIPMAEPFCPILRKLLFEQAKALKIACHEKGTVVTIEGPRFSTRAESNVFRSWNADVINMSTVPEVMLAREAGIHYASIAIVTDYDCWKAHEKAVDIGSVLAEFKKNVEKVKMLIMETIPQITTNNSCSCAEDIKTAVMS